jgi:hypothetical protein
VTRLVDLIDKRNPGRPQFLVGAGGMGKSTIARLVATRARESDQKRPVWWISAVNEERLSGGLVSLARQLGASTADQEMIRTHPVAGLDDVADRIWHLLDGSRPGWLLVIDNADDPELLGPPDGTGWIRTTNRGLLLVTTRNSNESSWPGGAELTPVEPLPVEAATDVLTDLAPRAGGREAARALAVRLGCLPLALRMAGMGLRQHFVAWTTFEQYLRTLDTEGVAPLLDASEQADPRAVITQTWELSLDALENAGLPQARPLLWLLSCYAPGSHIPVEMLTGAGRPALAELLDPDGRRSPRQLTQYCLAGLNGLASVSLIHRPDADDGPGRIVLHPFIAEVTRTVLDTGDHESVSPSLVRDSAVATTSLAIGGLDVGRVDDWPRFQVLTPHVQTLLADTAGRLGPRQRHDLLDCMVSCITSYLWSRAEPRAEQLAADALALARDLGCAGTPAYLRLRHVHAWAIRDQGKFTEAVESLRQVLEAQQALPDDAVRHDTLRTRHDMAWAIGRRGEWADAENELRHVLRECRRELEHDDAFTLHTRCKLCWCVGKQGRWDDAERDYRLLLADRAEILGPDHADTLDTRESLGKTLAWQDKWVEAEAEFGILAAKRRLLLGEDHPDTLLADQLEAYAAGLLARLRHDRKGQRAAMARLQRILRTQQDVRGTEHRNTKDGHAYLAVLRGTYSTNTPWTDDLPRPRAR